ncbi:MAG: flagellar basal body rod protein FlgB [Desulfobacteraceae bacterium]|nr:MAG: flagellar basal body rod protein FlgB [Desulfobacteraceae bacterium]
MVDLFDADPAWKVLEKSMDVSARRHRLITNNISNIATVGYTAKDMDFNKALEEALSEPADAVHRTHPKHMMQNPPSSAVRRRPGEEESGVEPSDIDTEMINLAENNLKYRTSVEMLLRKMNMIRHAIAEAGR